MKKALACLIILTGGIACNKDSYLRLKANQAVIDLLPDFSQPRPFRSEDDTTAIRGIGPSTYFERAEGVASGSGLGDFDYLELERRKLILLNDSPYYRINFNIATEYDGSRASQSRDVLSLSLDEEGQDNVASFQLEYTDSLRCLSANCAFADTLVIDSVNYFNVYYLAADTSQPAIFINEAQGLTGFRSTKNKTYQRIK